MTENILKQYKLKCQKVPRSLCKCSISLEIAGSKKCTSVQYLNSCLSVTGDAKEDEYDTDAVRNPNAADESNQKFQQLEDKRPVQSTEEEDERSVNVPPELEEASFSDNTEAKEVYNSERWPLADTSFGSTDSEESAREDTAAGNLFESGCYVALRTIQPCSSYRQIARFFTNISILCCCNPNRF